MKRIIYFIFALLLAKATLCQEYSSFDRTNYLDSITKIDKELSEKLNLFFENGYEKELEVGDLTPEGFISTARDYIGTPHCLGGI